MCLGHTSPEEMKFISFLWKKSVPQNSTKTKKDEALQRFHSGFFGCKATAKPFAWRVKLRCLHEEWRLRFGGTGALDVDGDDVQYGGEKPATI